MYYELTKTKYLLLLQSVNFFLSENIKLIGILYEKKNYINFDFKIDVADADNRRSTMLT